MIEIKDGEIWRDDSFIGAVIGDTAHLNEEQGANIKGQIRKAAKNPGLKFTLEATPAQEISLNKLKEANRILADDAHDKLNREHPLAVADPKTNKVTQFDVSTFGPISDLKYFKRCFVNHYGPTNWDAYRKANGIGDVNEARK